MKKTITIVLLCAMLLSCLAGCGMQRGTVNPGAYVNNAQAENLAVTVPMSTENVTFDVWEAAQGDTAYPTSITHGGTASAAPDLDGNTGETADDIRLDPTNPENNEIDYAGASIAWFNPYVKEQHLRSAEDLVGFLLLRLYSIDTTFMATYTEIMSAETATPKEITSTDLNCFDAYVFCLDVNVDLNGASVVAYHGDRAFEGTFDGQGHVIYNYTIELTSANKGFFSTLQGDGCIQNVSFLGGKYICKSGSSTAGSVVGVVKAVSGKTAVLSNVYSNADFSMKSGATAAFTSIGGLVAKISGSGSVSFTNCAFGGSINVPVTPSEGLQYAAGICSNINGGSLKEVTFTNCYTTSDAEIIAEGSHVAGIYAYNSSSANVKLQNCTNSATISGTQYIGGLVAYHKTAPLTMDTCINEGNITGTTTVGGIAGYLSGAATVEISGCTVTEGVTIAGGTMSGGIAGYVTNCPNVTVEGCTFSGTLTADRCSAGIVGFYNDEDCTVGMKMDDCTVDGTVTLNLVNTTNASAGGIIGRVRATYFEMTNCQFDGTLTATYSGDAAYFVGGLAGVLIDSDSTGTPVAVLKDNSVSGNLNFINNNANATKTYSAAVYFGTSGKASANVIYSGLSTDKLNINIGAKPEGTTYVAPQMISGGTSFWGSTVVGYQTTPVSGSVYDLRFIATVNGIDEADNAAIGFEVEIFYGAERTKKDTQTVYTSTAYKSITGGGKTYEASDYYADYLYALVINDIPEAYTVANGTLEIHVTPLYTVEVEGVETTNSSFTAQHGTIEIAA